MGRSTLLRDSTALVSPTQTRPSGATSPRRTEALTARRVETLSPSFFQKDENVTSHHILPIHIHRRRLQRLTAAKIHLQPHASSRRVSCCPFPIYAWKIRTCPIRSRIHHCKNPRFQIPNPSPYVVRVCECEGARRDGSSMPSAARLFSRWKEGGGGVGCVPRK